MDPKNQSDRNINCGSTQVNFSIPNARLTSIKKACYMRTDYCCSVIDGSFSSRMRLMIEISKSKTEKDLGIAEWQKVGNKVGMIA